MKVININSKKSEAPVVATTQRVVKSNVIVVDFANRKLVESIKTEEVVTDEYDFSNFNPIPTNTDSYFGIFTPHERMSHSEHILEHLHEIDYSEITYFVEQGVLDKVKLDQRIKELFANKK